MFLEIARSLFRIPLENHTRKYILNRFTMPLPAYAIDGAHLRLVCGFRRPLVGLATPLRFSGNVPALAGMARPLTYREPLRDSAQRSYKLLGYFGYIGKLN